MITENIDAIKHISVYRRIEPFYPGRKRVITDMELFESGMRREPDAEVYRRDFLRCCWILKE